MDVTTWIDALRTEGRWMGHIAAKLSPDARVPSCPGWLVRDLIRHTGRVHRWAGLVISESRTEPPSGLEEVVPRGWPSDDLLVDWFREGHGRLVATLEVAPPDLRCWTFMDAPSPRDFWARRQAHETSIHRVDAELVAGAPSGFDPAYAADGIDELLVSFITRPGRSPSARGDMTLGVVATDVGRRWTATFGPDGAYGGREAGRADCTVSGSAAELFPFVWNRTPLGDLRVEGDQAVLEQWRESSAF